jgi:hypothetical protein
MNDHPPLDYPERTRFVRGFTVITRDGAQALHQAAHRPPHAAPHHGSAREPLSAPDRE